MVWKSDRTVTLERFTDQTLEMPSLEIENNLPIPCIQCINLERGQLENLLFDHLELTHD